MLSSLSGAEGSVGSDGTGDAGRDDPATDGACAGGLYYDDGSFENGYSGNRSTVSDFTIAQAFTPTSYPTGFSTACFHLTTIDPAPVDVTVNVQVRDDDGAGGAPGTVLWTSAETFTSVPVFGSGGCAEYAVDLPGDLVEDGSIYVGYQFDPSANPSMLTCSDESANPPVTPGYVDFGQGDGLQPISSFFAYRALGIRLLPGDPDLSVSLVRFSGDPLRVGKKFAYRATITNNGIVTAGGVELTATLPGALTGVPAITDSRCAYTGQDVSCSLGDLAVGESETLRLGVRAAKVANTVLQSVAVSTTGSETVTSDNTDSVTSAIAPNTCRTSRATIVGTRGDDVLVGTPGPDVIKARAGDDVIKGLGADDVLCGGLGDDVIAGGGGNDSIYGGRGDDVLAGNANKRDICGPGPGKDAVRPTCELGVRRGSVYRLSR